LKNFSTLKSSPLFAEIEEEDLSALLACLSGRSKSFKKDEAILLEGDKPTSVGIVISGDVHIVKDDYFGNRNIIAHVKPGGMFGDAFVCAGAETTPVTAVANADSEILFIDYNRIITNCPSTCGFHTMLIRNMLRILAQNNMSLVDKLEHVTRRTTREKVLSYLSDQAKQQGSSSFTIPFNRQEMADFLSVERSALSAELSKLRDEGQIKFNKNQFELL
jgi:CRP-like cAMP-binding protein